MKILALGAHPDDLEYGCGGTLLKYCAAGHKIYLMVMTKGQFGGKSTVREKEQSQSARALKARLYWGNLVDTQLKIEKNIINRIEKTIHQIKPDLIFVHYYNDTHQDHRTVSQATITATRYIRNVIFYEVPTTVDFTPATLFVDIGDVLTKKIDLLKQHRSQVFATRVANLSILESVEATALFRGFQNRVKYAEAFVPLRLTLPIPTANP